MSVLLIHGLELLSYELATVPLLLLKSRFHSHCWFSHLEALKVLALQKFVARICSVSEINVWLSGKKTCSV